MTPSTIHHPPPGRTAPRATTKPNVDFGSIAARVDLVELAGSLGIEVRNGRAFCPFHNNTNTPAMSLFLRGDRWRFRCHSCGMKGDGVAFFAAYHGVSMVDAARQLGGIDERPGPTVGPRPARAARPEVVEEGKPSPPADPEWQAVVDGIIARAEATLWGPEGGDARAFLASRGLAEHVVRGFRLGFVPRDYGTRPLEVLRKEDDRPRPIYVARGITLPWPASGTTYSGESTIPRWVGANVRRLMSDVFEPMPANRKYLALLGSARGHAYPWPDLLPSQVGPPALIVEGEVDALLAHQEIGHLAHAMTVGGATQAPHPTALEALDRCPIWLLALDHDEAGTKAASRWRGRYPRKTRRVLLPIGKDVGEFVQAGGDLRGWIAGEIDRARVPAGPAPAPDPEAQSPTPTAAVPIPEAAEFAPDPDPGLLAPILAAGFTPIPPGGPGPAWAGDDRLAVSMADVRASTEFDDALNMLRHQ